MKAIQLKSAAFSGATQPERPVNPGETAASLLTATAGPEPEARPDWSAWREEDSSFFVPERCTALDDF